MSLSRNWQPGEVLPPHDDTQEPTVSTKIEPEVDDEEEEKYGLENETLEQDEGIENVNEIVKREDTLESVMGSIFDFIGDRREGADKCYPTGNAHTLPVSVQQMSTGNILKIMEQVDDQLYTFASPTHNSICYPPPPVCVHTVLKLEQDLIRYGKGNPIRYTERTIYQEVRQEQGQVEDQLYTFASPTHNSISCPPPPICIHTVLQLEQDLIRYGKGNLIRYTERTIYQEVRQEQKPSGEERTEIALSREEEQFYHIQNLEQISVPNSDSDSSIWEEDAGKSASIEEEEYFYHIQNLEQISVHDSDSDSSIWEEDVEKSSSTEEEEHFYHIQNQEWISEPNRHSDNIPEAASEAYANSICSTITIDSDILDSRINSVSGEPHFDEYNSELSEEGIAEEITIEEEDGNLEANENSAQSEEEDENIAQSAEEDEGGDDPKIDGRMQFAEECPEESENITIQGTGDGGITLSWDPDVPESGNMKKYSVAEGTGIRSGSAHMPGNPAGSATTLVSWDDNIHFDQFYYGTDTKVLVPSALHKRARITSTTRPMMIFKIEEETDQRSGTTIDFEWVPEDVDAHNRPSGTWMYTKVGYKRPLPDNDSTGPRTKKLK